ncbi:unnamed protein product, partial [marine sediment metagenome]
QVMTKLVDMIRQEFDTREQGVNKLQSQFNESLVQSARKGIQEDYPQLASDETFETVKSRYESLMAQGGYQDPREAFRHAAAIELADQRALDIQTKQMKRHETKKNGQPRAKTKTNAPAKVDPDTRAFSKFKELHAKHIG